MLRVSCCLPTCSTASHQQYSLTDNVVWVYNLNCSGKLLISSFASTLSLNNNNYYNTQDVVIFNNHNYYYTCNNYISLTCNIINLTSQTMDKPNNQLGLVKNATISILRGYKLNVTAPFLLLLLL